jgi:hypothetical protein
MEDKEFIVNKIIEEVLEKISNEDKVVINFKDIVGNFEVGFTTAYTVMAILEKKIPKILGNGIKVFRRRGKLIIVKEEEKTEEGYGV